MGLLSKLEIEYRGMFFFTIFYLIAGIANFVIAGMGGLRLFHVALVAILSLIAAFGGLYGSLSPCSLSPQLTAPSCLTPSGQTMQ